MESTPLSTSGDQESDFDTKKKPRRFEFFTRPDDEQSLKKSRHMAREALRHEEAKKPAPLFALSEAMLAKPKEASAEAEDNEEDAEADGVGEGLDKAEMQSAAQALRHETRQHRDEADETSEPAVIAAGDLLVDEWDDRIEAGQDVDEALAEVLREHDIPSELFDDTAEAPAESVWQSEAAMPSPDEDLAPHDFADDEVVISRHETPAASSENSHDNENSSYFASESSQDAARPNVEHSQANSHKQPSIVDSVTNRFAARRGNAVKHKEVIEKQVDNLSWELKAKEAKIRQVAAEHVQRHGPKALEAMRAESAHAEQRSSEDHEAETDGLPALHIANRPTEHRQRAPEANQLHGGAHAHEHIGHVLVTAEAANRGKEAPKAQMKERVQLPPDKRIETLSRQELLVMSEQIAVEGSTLRDVYETHLIGEHALRRLVAEYLHGGDVVRALQREIVEHEIDFERDPALRDIAVTGEADESQEAKQVAAPGKEALTQLLQKAEAGISASDDDFIYDKSDTQDKLKSEPRSYRPAADTIMGAIIIMLIFLVAILYIWHH